VTGSGENTRVSVISVQPRPVAIQRLVEL